MTEKEKMLRQMLYDANNDADLIEERKVAKDLCYDFNNLRPSDSAGQPLPCHTTNNRGGQTQIVE